MVPIIYHSFGDHATVKMLMSLKGWPLVRNNFKLNNSLLLTRNIPNIIRPRRSRSVAAYSRQTFPWTICRSVRLSVCLSSALWENGGSDANAVWHRRSDGSRHEADSGVLGSVHRKGYFWGANLGRAVVKTNGDFTAYVRNSAATRPSCQVILGRLVMMYFTWIWMNEWSNEGDKYFESAVLLTATINFAIWLLLKKNLKQFSCLFFHSLDTLSH